jgi:hypothetical protein
MCDNNPTFTHDQVLHLIHEILQDHAVRIVGVICSEQPPDSTIRSLMHCLDVCYGTALGRLHEYSHMSEEGIEIRPPLLGEAVQAFRRRIAGIRWDQEIASA